MKIDTMTTNYDASSTWARLQSTMVGTNPNAADNLDSVLADAMNQLSFEDREKISHALHGVDFQEESPGLKGFGNIVKNGSTESPEFMSQKLSELNSALQRIKEQPQGLPTAALNLAEQLSPEYVHDPKFLTTFLKCDNYDTTLAAKRMVHYFDFKFSLFGGSKLCKPVIGLEDLDKDDIFALERGFIQVLPIRDRAGRPVCIIFPDKQEYAPGCDIATCFGRILFFVYSNLTEQFNDSRGVVQVNYAIGQNLNVDQLYPQCPPVVFKSLRALPLKNVSYHFCFNHPAFRLVIQSFLLGLGLTNINAIAKVHQGSQQEVLYSLMTYGIPTDQFPVNFKNDIKRTNHMEMIQMIRIREDAASSYLVAKANNKVVARNTANDCVVLPLLVDVLFGKGTLPRDYPGNLRLKMMIDELLQLHATLSQDDKAELARQVVATIQEMGGRFLSKETGVWKIVHDNVARDRVATMFRNRKKVMAKKTKQQQKAIAQVTTKLPRRITSLDESMCILTNVQSNKRVKV